MSARPPPPRFSLRRPGVGTFAEEGVAVPVGVALLAALLAIAGCTRVGPDAVRAADTLYAEGHWEQAAAAYQQLPESAGAWRAYGVWRAAAIFRDALKDPERAEAAFTDCARGWSEGEWGYTCQVELEIGRASCRERV